MSLPPARASTSKGVQSETVNPEIMAKKIECLCEKLIDKYENSPDLAGILNALVNDKTSIIYNKYNEFVETILLQAIRLSPISRAKIGVMFSELLNMKIITHAVLTEGIGKIITKSLLNFTPHLSTRIADILTPMMVTTPQCFSLTNLKNAYSTISSQHRTDYFCELIRRIAQSKTKLDGIEKKRGIFWAYRMWFSSENHLSIVEFVDNQHLNSYFTDGQIGIFVMAAALSERMEYISINNLVNSIKLWITNHISEINVLHPLFTRTLTIAIFSLCAKHHHHNHANFFHDTHMRLMAYYIQYRKRTVTEMIDREVQCLYGIQMMCTALRYPERVAQTLFQKLYQSSTIGQTAFLTWKDDGPGVNKFDEDFETKRSIIQALGLFFDWFIRNNAGPS